MKRTALLCIAITFWSATTYALDKDTASAYATSAETSAKDGKTELAKNLCYSALALDENCPIALYTLGTIFEKEGNSATAADFLVRASHELAKDEANKDFAFKRSDAEARIKHLNEFAPRFTTAMAEYTQELNTITKKSPDSMTLDEACDRADALNLRSILSPDKGPKFEREALKTPAKSPASRTPDDIPGLRPKKEIVTNVPPDVERALKKAGWETITGTWKKKSENVYEVTDGKLETAKMIGSIQVIVDKGGTGSVKAFVRDGFKQYSRYISTGSGSGSGSSGSGSGSGSISSFSSRSGYATGFGFVITGGNTKMYTPYSYSMSMTSSAMHPYMEREIPTTGEKTYYRVTIEESKLEYWVNTKKEKTAPYKVAKEGPFSIEIDGTMTIEDPRSVGQ